MTPRPTSSTAPFFDTLGQALTWIGSALERAITDPQDGWHLGSFAYQTPEGPQAKTVVWRGFDRTAAQLWFYTDTRSSKWAALARDPKVGALLYCSKRQVQLALQARAQAETGTPATRAQFNALSTLQQEAYISQAPPGAPLVSQRSQTPHALKFESEPRPAPNKHLDPKLGDRFFGCVRLTISNFDFVSLHRTGHQRLSGHHFTDTRRLTWLCP